MGLTTSKSACMTDMLFWMEQSELGGIANPLEEACTRLRTCTVSAIGSASFRTLIISPASCRYNSDLLQHGAADCIGSGLSSSDTYRVTKLRVLAADEIRALHK